MTTLGFERASGGQGITMKRTIDELVRLATKTMRNGRPAIEDPAIRSRLAQGAIEGQITVLNGFRILSARLKRQAPGPEAQMGKVFRSELNVRMTELATEILGPESILDKGDETIRRWQYSFLRAKGNTIEMGTSEILRNVIGERILGLPR
jgi:alkylation response protein AidB-like acyl-CoA dehydrogenase